MTVYIEGHSFDYEMENVARMFFGDVTVKHGKPEEDAWEYVYLQRDGMSLHCEVEFEGCHRQSDDVGGVSDKDDERLLAVMMYDSLCRVTAKRPPWGVMTGIRPAKFAASLLNEGSGAEKVIERLCRDYRVTPSKAALCVSTAMQSARAAGNSTEKSYSLYVSIPFCPSRCSYCSFVSKTVGRDRSMLGTYLEKLCEELRYTAAIAKKLDLHLESAYIGGGTPSVLDAAQLKTLTDTVNAEFGADKCPEYCVEAGRPDTITRDKLDVLKAAGITRISINPQTGSDEVLKKAGRLHTRRDIEDCFAMAREAGFDNINADLIAGLPGDSLEGFEDSLNWISSLDPENITVHALTLKRASFLTETGDRPAENVSAMVDYALDFLSEKNYQPYYMYKQKGTVDSLENTGYAKPGYECLYNIYIMDEIHTILACGGGAVTKMKNPRTGRIERIFNYKYPNEYINGFDEILRRKDGVEKFYSEFTE